MKKLYTYNHKNITTCANFDVKFKCYLEYIKKTNISLYNLFVDNIDFEIQDVNEFKNEFNAFFETWLKEVYNYNLVFNRENIDFFVDNFSTIDDRYNELFANYNFYKKINLAEVAFFIYDITVDEETKYLAITKKSKMNFN